jgi:hypothetical protein
MEAARFSKFLQPLKDLATNWNIDVAKDLEEYLDELEGLKVSFDGGKSTLNFAEASLLIQGTTVVYSRKVEYLYSLVYHALDVLSAKGACGRGEGGLPSFQSPHLPTTPRSCHTEPPPCCCAPFFHPHPHAHTPPTHSQPPWAARKRWAQRPRRTPRQRPCCPR